MAAAFDIGGEVAVSVRKNSDPGDGAALPRLRSFDRSLPMALLRGREAVMRHFRMLLRRHGITEQQWRVLRALTAGEQMEILALAETTFLLPPSLSRILRDLEKRKLIVRRASPDDLRRGLVSISPRGVALIEKVGAQSEAIYGEITRRYGAEKLRALHDLLGRLEQVLSEPVGATWPNTATSSTGKRTRRGGERG